MKRPSVQFNWLQLAFLGESDPNFPMGEIPIGTTQNVKNTQKNTKKQQPPPVTELRLQNWELTGLELGSWIHGTLSLTLDQLSLSPLVIHPFHVLTLAGWKGENHVVQAGDGGATH